MKEVRLVGCDLVALVDDNDFELVSRFTWYKHQPHRSKTPYAKTNPQGSNVYLHRLILGLPPYHVDHVDGNGLNCQRYNMRPATRVQQNANTDKINCGGKSHSKYKGVHRHHTGKWVARIHTDSKPTHLGIFEREEDAARAYNDAASFLFGEYARLNEIYEGDRDQ